MWINPARWECHAMTGMSMTARVTSSPLFRARHTLKISRNLTFVLWQGQKAGSALIQARKNETTCEGSQD